jgi:thymidylate synthase (FAD)
MRIIEPSIEILSDVDANRIMRNIETCGRVCYKSENLINEESAKKFIKRIIANGHESVLEHEKLTIKFICDRGVSHEIVRHRIASYSQESTRYCNYSREKFGKELTLIRPCFWKDDEEKYRIWCDVMEKIEYSYNELISIGAKPEEARSILPNSLKTEIVVTMNLRELRHFLRLRTSPKAHPQMREVANMLLNYVKETLPVFFEDIGNDYAE